MCLFIMFSINILSSIKWMLISDELSSKKISLSVFFKIVMISSFIGQILPNTIGQYFMKYFLFKNNSFNIKTSDIIKSIIDKIFLFLGLFSVIILTFPVLFVVNIIFSSFF